MGATKLLILENILGQKVRTFAVDSDSLHLVYIKESRRIEAVSNLNALDQDKIEYKVIKKIDVKAVSEQGLALKGLGRIRLYPAAQILQSPIHLLPVHEDDSRLNLFLKRTTAGHMAFVMLLMGITWGIKHFAKEDETPLVTIVLPKEEPPVKVVEKPKPVPHVKMAEHKIKETKKIYKPVAQKKVLKTRPYKVNTAKAVDVQRVGALAALGGLPKGSKGSEGLDMNSLKNIRSAGTGSGGGGVGNAGRGGIKGYLPGSGLIAGSSGNGGRAESAGGYGTRGVGGGKAGYGKIAKVGGMSAVSLALDEEATVEGGLDRDQIIAVINRNKGQIVYCYERGLQSQPTIGGRVAVDFTIGPNGRINAAKVAQSSVDSRSVENCIVSHMKAWQFPRPVGGVNVDVLYPFELMRVSSR